MRALVFVLLLLVAPSVLSAWEKVAETSDATWYVDPASVADAGEYRRVTAVQDPANPQPGGVLSRRVVYEVDCRGGRLRSVAVEEFAGPRAEGASLRAWERESEWLHPGPRTGSHLAPRTPYGAILKITCDR